MKKKFFVRTLSVLLIFAALAVSVVSVSAADSAISLTELGEYELAFYVAGCDGPTSDGITCKIGGTLGETDEVKLDSACNSEGICTATLVGKNVGEVTSISVKTNTDNYLFLEKVDIKSPFTQDSITIYGGRWVYDSFFRILKTTDYVHKVSIKTSDETYSGTDLIACLCVNKEFGVDLNDISSKNVFEEGNTDEFYLYTGASSVYTFQIHMCLDWNAFRSASSDWKLEKITFESVQGKDGETTSYTPDCWLGYNEFLNMGKESGTTRAYSVAVKTADESLAGTDANLYLTLFGSESKTYSFCMDNAADMYSDGNSTNFERKNLDKFKISSFRLADPSKDIGELQKIAIKNSGSGLGADWKMDYITITEMVADGESYKSYTFSLNDWIDGGETKYLTNPTIKIYTPEK